MTNPTPFDAKILAQLEQYIPIIQLKRKVQTAALDMMEKVHIDPSHNYTRVSDGKWMAGVTSVSSLVPKDWLAAWGAKESVKALGFSDFPEDTELAKKMLLKIAGIGKPLLDVETEAEATPAAVKEYVAILKEAKGASARKKKDALVDGKAGHAWIEQYIKAKIGGTKLPVLPKKEDLLARPLSQFVEWEREHVALWLLSEARVCDLEREYAGTLDAVALMSNTMKPAIIDAKFASHLSPEYSLQTAGYAATFEPYGVDLSRRIVVRLPKTLEKPEWNPETHKYTMIENTIEPHEIQTEYAWDRDVFYSALPVKKWVNANLKR